MRTNHSIERKHGRICVNLFMKEKVVTVSDAVSLSSARGHMSITLYPIKDNELLKLDPNNLMLLCSKCHPIVENETEDKKFSLRISIEAPYPFSKFFRVGR